MRFHLTIIILINSIFSLIALIKEVKYIKKHQTIEIVTLCRLMYVLLVCIVPTIIYYAYLKEEITSLIKYEKDYIWTFWVNTLLTIIAYVMFDIGTKIKQKKFKVREIKRSDRTNIVTSVFIIISCIALFKWAAGFGGIKSLIKNANSIRAGFVVSSGNAFFKHFVPLALLSSLICFYSLIIDNNKKMTSKCYLGLIFIISLVISIIYILANDGRMLVGIYILLFLIIFIKNQYEKEGKILKMLLKMLLIGSVSIILILNADNLFRKIKGAEIKSNNNSSILAIITNEFSFIVTGTQTAAISRNENMSNYMIKNDIINGLFAWLPTKIKPITYTDVWDYNTLLINPGVHGQLPTSIVAQSVYDLGIFGIILVPLMYGYLVKKIQEYIASYKNDIFFNTTYVVLGFYLAKGMSYFSLYNIMINVFFVVIGWIIYSVIYKVKIKY